MRNAWKISLGKLNSLSRQSRPRRHPAPGRLKEVTEEVGGLNDIQEKELEFLRRRVADLETLHSVPGRQVLPVTDDLLAGYLILEREERRYTAWAMARHSDFVLVWYRFLNLLKSAFENLGDEVSHPEFTTQTQLAFQFIAATGGSVKLILDAGLAGYYAQAYTLVRHVFETWLRLEYIKLRPEMAEFWFIGPQGEEPRPPGEQAIHSYVRKNTRGQLKTVVGMVIDKLQTLNKMAHPTQFFLQQTVGAREGQFNIGANYDPELCVGVLHEGASGLRFILAALNDIAPQPEWWRKELLAVSSAHTACLEAELGPLEEMRKEAKETEHWILARVPTEA